MDNYMLFFFCLILIVGIVGFVGNVIVIIIYLYDRSLRSFTNYFFVNLSIVDILIILICLPVGLLDIANEGIWILGKHVCNFQHFIECTLISVSSLTLSSISLERYFAISRPFNIGRLINKKMSIVIIIALWLISIAFSAPLMYYTTYFREVNNNTVVEYCYNDRTSLFPKVYVSSFTAVFVFAPTLILSGVYIIIIKKLKQLNEGYFYHKTAATNSNSPNSGHGTTKPNQAKGDRNSKEAEYYTSSAASSNSYSMKIKYNPNPNNSLASGAANNTNNNNSQQTLKLLRSKKTIAAAMNKPSKRESMMALKPQNSERKKHPRDSLAVTDVSKNTGSKSSYGKNLIAKRNQTITICLISLAFFFCQIPIKIFQIFNAFYEFENTTAEIDLIRFKIMNIIFLSSKLLFFLHGMSNPIIYNLMSTKFRKSFKNVILCKPLNKNYSYVHKFFFKIPTHSMPNIQAVNNGNNGNIINNVNNNNNNNKFIANQNNAQVKSGRNNSGVVVGVTNNLPANQLQQPKNSGNNESRSQNKNERYD